MKDLPIKNLFGNAKWIWLDKTGLCQFAEFIKEFDYKGQNKVFLEISAPTTYAVWINGQYVFNGQYGDYDFYKVYDKIEVTSFAKQGKPRRPSFKCKIYGDCIEEPKTGNAIICEHEELNKEDSVYKKFIEIRNKKAK